MKMFRITWMPGKVSVYASPEETLGEVANRLGLCLPQPCGGFGVCGKCRVLVKGGTSTPNKIECSHLSPKELSTGWRLACQCPVEEGLVVYLDPELSGSTQILHSFCQKDRETSLRPLLEKRVFTFEMPKVGENPLSLLEQMERALEIFPLKASPRVLNALAKEVLSLAKNPLEASLFQNWLLDVSSTPSSSYGAAIDIGTTTLVCYLIDLQNGTRMDVLSDLNPQVRFGDDVISRISFAERDPEGLAKLHRVLLESLNRLLHHLSLQNGLTSKEIRHVVVASNTCMQHLFLGVSPSGMGRSPFIPTYRRFPHFSASEVGLQIHPEGRISCLPNISAYVGSDIVAGISVTKMDQSKSISLLVDIGTNNEIVLGNRDFLFACSAAAGPAFEGARIRCGMRGSVGAIERVSLTKNGIHYSVIGGGRPRGLCGSGLVDLVAEMLRGGLIEPSGRMVCKEDSPFFSRFGKDPQEGLFFSVTDAIGDEKSVILTQKDVREVQLAKGAISAGIDLLLEKASLRLEDVETLFIAGAFGNYLDKEKAKAIGLLPPIPSEKILSIGNSAGNGACRALLDREEFKRMEEICKKTQVIELSVEKDFQSHFLKALPFPSNKN